MFKINLLRGFLYPLTSMRRLAVSWLVLPVSLAVLVPPILFGLGVLGTVDMNLGQGLGFTALVGGVCFLVGITPFTFLAGYMLRCRKRVIAGDNVLPPWSGLGDLLSEGGKMDTLAVMIGLPTMALFWTGVLSVAGPLTYLSHERTWAALAIALVGSSTGLVFLLAALAWWLMVLLISPMATLRLALGLGPFTAVSLSGVFRFIRSGWFDYLLCCVVVWAISVGFSCLQAAFWPLVIVSFPVQVYLQLVWAHLLGQYARVYLPEMCQGLTD